eukprot:GGOE01045111.1.p1 GENE.GGOE01045111.1~~GGOE01045111.1.p1  ORF type:complete len:689 (+),score=140.01 GGOE01045111.1:232-2298(+)
MTPREWYVYDEAHQELKRKPDREMTVSTIKQEFGREPQGGRLAGRLVRDMAAQYLYSSGPAGAIAVDFLSPAEIERFLTKRSKKGESLLQRFVYPKGHRNGVLQAIWSPHVFRCDRRYNVNKLCDSHVPRYERGVTFEGPMAHSEQAYCSQDLERHLRSVCGDIAAHLMETDRRAISRMVLYFKLDLDDRLWFLWASCLRVQTKSKANVIPLNFAPTFSISKQSAVDVPLRGASMADSAAWPPKVPSDLLACPQCGRDFRGLRLPLALEHILHYRNAQRQREARQRQLFSMGDVTINPAALRNRSRLELLRHLRAISPKRFQALARLELVVVGGPDPLLSKEETMATQAKVGAFVRQLDAVLYEAHSYFQTSTAPFRFTLQVDLPLDTKESVLNALAAAPFCEPVQDLPERSAVIGSVLGKMLRTARMIQPRNAGGLSREEVLEPELLLPDDIIEAEAQQAARRRIERAARRHFSDDDEGLDAEAALALCGVTGPEHDSSSEDDFSSIGERRLRNSQAFTRQSSTCSRTSCLLPPSHVSFCLSWAHGTSLRALRLHFDSLKDIAWSAVQSPQQIPMPSSSDQAQSDPSPPPPAVAKASTVPGVLHALFPTQKAETLLALCDDPMFIRQPVLLCQSCFLRVSDGIAKDLHHRRLPDDERRGCRPRSAKAKGGAMQQCWEVWSEARPEDG